jgi:uncharacterized RDD family membrane protein YckC
MMARIIPLYVIVIVGSWLYYALMESSEKQATLGKMAVGIKVTGHEWRQNFFRQCHRPLFW